MVKDGDGMVGVSCAPLEDRGVQRKQAVAGDEEKIFPLMIDADSTRPPASPPGILPVRLIPPPRVCVRPFLRVARVLTKPCSIGKVW
jgi:hypothetical protein